MPESNNNPPVKTIGTGARYDNYNEPIVKSKGVMDLIWSYPVKKMRADLNSLYDFYYYTAKWQGTNQVWATTNYTANHFGWPEDRVQKAKKVLITMGLIEDVVTRDSNNRITKHYVLVKFLWGREAIDKLKELRPELFISAKTAPELESFHPPVFPPPGDSTPLDFRGQMLKGELEIALSANSKIQKTKEPNGSLSSFDLGASRRKRKPIPIKTKSPHLPPETNQPRTIADIIETNNILLITNK